MKDVPTLTRHRKRFLLVTALILGLVWTGLDSHPVKACSGEELSLSALSNDSGLIVKATVLSVDALSINGTLRVERYFKGNGPEFLLLVQTPPVEMYRFVWGDAGGSCDTSGGPLIPGESLYLFLVHQMDGSYRPTYRSSLVPFKIRFSTPNAQLRLNILDATANSPVVRQTVDEQGFQKLLTKFVEKPPSAPKTGGLLPWTAPLLVRTRNGSVYMVPVDHGQPIKLSPDLFKPSGEDGFRKLARWWYGLSVSALSPDVRGCDQVGCDATQLNGVWSARIEAPQTIRLTSAAYVGIDGLFPSKYEAEYLPKSPMSGQAFLFSPTAKVAVWQEKTLQVLSLLRYTYEYMPPIDNNNAKSANLAANEDGKLACTIACAVWSADDTRLAFSDAKGLWLWTVDSSDAPVLVMRAANGNIPIPRYFSPRGNFLATTFGKERFNLRLANQEHWPDGIFSPDERSLLTNNLDRETLLPEICYDPATCKLTAPAPTDFRLVREQWLTLSGDRGPRFTFVALVCRAGKSDDCFITGGTSDGRGAGARSGIDFDYTAQNGLVLLNDRYTISVDQDYDLRRSVDSEIVGVRWLPSLLNSKPQDAGLDAI